MCVPPEAQRSFFKSILPGQDVVCSYLIVCKGRKQPIVLLTTTSNIPLTTFLPNFCHLEHYEKHNIGDCGVAFSARSGIFPS